MYSTYKELVVTINKRPKMSANDYWFMIVDNATLIFWEAQDHPRRAIAADLGITQPEFSLVYKIVSGIASRA